MKCLKHTFLIIALSAPTFGARAQTKTPASANGTRISIGGDLGVPLGSISSYNTITLGASVQADVPATRRLYLTFNTGYTNFLGNNVYVADASSYYKRGMQIIPVKAGLKLFATDIFYFQGEAGVGFLLNSSKTYYSKPAAFIYAPQVGVLLPLTDETGNVDLGVRYEGSGSYNASAYASSPISFVALRMAYSF